MHFMEIRPIFIGQTTYTMSYTQFLLTYNHDTTVAQQFIVM